MDKQQNHRLKDILSALTSNRNESLYQSFLIGTAYIRYKMDERTLLAFTQGVEQLVQLSTSMGRQDLIEELYNGLLQGKQEAPIKFIETLTDRLFQQDGQDFNKISNNADEDLIRKMMQEEERQQKEIQQMDDLQVRKAVEQIEEEERLKSLNNKRMENLNNESWNCEICFEQMTDSQFWPLECKHQFHRECLQQYFNAKIKDRNLPLKCPNQQCLKEVDYRDIKEILTKAEFQKYEEFSLNNYIESNLDEISWCPSAGCKYAFVLEDNQEQLICPLCRKRYCLTCKCEYHKNQTCKEYQVANTYSEQDKRFEQFVRGQKFKQCLNCKMWVEKNQGCDHMRCRCGCEFCYKCGGPYMKCACHGH